MLRRPSSSSKERVVFSIRRNGEDNKREGEEDIKKGRKEKENGVKRE